MPWKLWFAVGGLLIVDVILLTIWTAVDPLKRDVHNFEKKPSSDPELDIEYQPQLEHCKSNHHSVWMGKSIQFSSDVNFTAQFSDHISIIRLMIVRTDSGFVLEKSVSTND